MTDWLQRHGGSHSLQLAGVAVISGVAVASSIFGYQSVKRRDAIDRLKASIPPSAADTTREVSKYFTMLRCAVMHGNPVDRRIHDC